MVQLVIAFIILIATAILAGRMLKTKHGHPAATVALTGVGIAVAIAATACV